MVACASTVTGSRKLLITNDKLYRTSRRRTALSLRAFTDKATERRMDDYWIWWILAAVLSAPNADGHVLPARRRRRVRVRRRRRLARASLPMHSLTAGVLAVVGTMVAHRWRVRAAIRRPRRGSTSGRACASIVEARRHGARGLPRHAMEWRARIERNAAPAHDVHRRDARSTLCSSPSAAHERFERIS